MKKSLLSLLFVFAAARLHAARHISFETEAFNQVGIARGTTNAVFSPLSFEIDCTLVAVSLETLPKAKVAEKMDIVIGFENVYKPILEALAEPTNGLDFIATRGFCVPELAKSRVDVRFDLERDFGAEVMRYYPKDGAECWFRASMEGTMEDFAIDPAKSRRANYALYDLVACFAEWAEPFPTNNTRRLPFRPDPSAEPVMLEFMSDVRPADTWVNEDYTLMRLPLKGDAWLYAMLPNEDRDLTPVRADFTSAGIDRLLAMPKLPSDPSVSHDPCVIVFPRLEFRDRTDFTKMLTDRDIPLSGLRIVPEGVAVAECVQETRFRLAEHGRGEPALAEKPADAVVAATPGMRKLVFNRPFAYLVYHEKTATVLIAGQFFGR